MAKKKPQEKMTAQQQEGSTEVLRAVLSTYGPLSVRAMYPDYAEQDVVLNNYSFWYVAHINKEALTNETFKALQAKFAKAEGGLEGGLEEFAGWLEGEGYIILSSGPDGAIEILTGDD